MEKTKLLDKEQVRKNCCNLANVNFKKKGPKVKKTTFLYFMTTFLNFTLKTG